MSTSKIDKRDDVNPERGEREYGDAQFADPTNKKYPIDTEKHIHAAWSYIHRENDAAKYSPDDVEKIKHRIKAAAKQHSIELHSNKE